MKINKGDKPFKLGDKVLFISPNGEIYKGTIVKGNCSNCPVDATSIIDIEDHYNHNRYKYVFDKYRNIIKFDDNNDLIYINNNNEHIKFYKCTECIDDCCIKTNSKNRRSIKRYINYKLKQINKDGNRKTK